MKDLTIVPLKGVLEVTAEWFTKTPIRGNDMMLWPPHGPACSLFEPCDAIFKNFLEHVGGRQSGSD